MDKQTENYVISCKMIVEDLANHVDACNEELKHYKAMVNNATKQLDISSSRLEHEKVSLKHYLKSIEEDEM